MNKKIRKILKEPVENLSKATEIDIHSKKIDLLEHTSMFVNSIIKNNDPTDTAFNA
ncbi:MAG: hypothetical protein ACP5SF_05070 [Thermoplasmata archaeon]